MLHRSVRSAALAPGFALALVLGLGAPLAAQTPPAAPPASSAASAAPAAPVTPSPSAAKDSRLFEMRTYYTSGRDRAEALHKRFRDHTLKLFEKHGMTNVAYWIPEDKPDVLVYVLAFPSRAARDASWKAFVADPAWLAAKKASEESVGGGSLTTKIDSVFMQATDYSKVK